MGVSGMLVARAGAVIAAASLALLSACADPVKSTPVTADIGPAELGTFPAGSSWDWLRNGEPLKITLVAKDDDLGRYESSNGCIYSQFDDFLIPETEYINCYDYSGTTETAKPTPVIWPLQVGKEISWSTKSLSKTGERWTSHHSCKVESAENITVPAGTFDTYKIVCSDEGWVIQHYYAPRLRTDVLTTFTVKGEGLRSKWELVAAPPFST